MKIALLGSAPSSLHRAPFKNAAYITWLEGRTEKLNRAHGDVPGNFEIWACSPGCWAGAPRASRWFEVHRWEPHQSWFSPEYIHFLQDFKGPVYTGGRVPEIQNHVVYPIDRMEKKFASYFMTSSLALMLALAIDTVEGVRAARRIHAANEKKRADLDAGVPNAHTVQGFEIPNDMTVEQFQAELEKPDSDDLIGMWGVDMAANEEYGYQRPGCQFFILEAMRREIPVYMPPESDLMRPMPVYGISEWDHNYIKLTARARELNGKAQDMQKQVADLHTQVAGAQGEMQALNHFVNTWTSPYGMQHGVVIRQEPGTGLGSGITHVDERPVQRIAVDRPAQILQAMSDEPERARARAFMAILEPKEGEDPEVALRRVMRERDGALGLAADRLAQLTALSTKAPKKKGSKKRRR